MNTATKTQPLTERVHEFFANNPSEELTYEQIAIKFDLTQRQAHAVIDKLKSKGMVEAVYVIRLASMN